MLHPRIQKTLAEAVNIAINHSHEFVALEHVLLALTQNHPARRILESCGVNLKLLRDDITKFLNKNYTKNSSREKSIPNHRNLEPPQTTLSLQRALQQAVIQVQSCNKKEVEESHLLVSFFSESESYAVYFLKKHGVTRYQLVKSSSLVQREATAQSPATTSYRKPNSTEEFSESTGEEDLPPDPLEFFCDNLNEKILEKKQNTLIGREDELERVIHILSRKNKNNPLFIGEAGVGKTALAYGLAERIVAGKVPASLKGANIYSLNLTHLLAGTKYRGDFEARFQGITESLKEKSKPILFIDELQTIMGAGSTSGGSLDMVSLLKPFLSQGEIRYIGATSYKDYRRNIEKNQALSRQFQKVDVKEPSLEETLRILKGIKKQYEDFHKVVFSEEILDSIVELSDKYLKDQFFPDKAIDVLDELGAKIKLEKRKTVQKKDVEKVISSMSKTPLDTVSKDEVNFLKTLEDELKNVIFGQTEAVEKLTLSIKLSRSGLKPPDQPMGSYLFVGPTGVGKTELAKQLSHCLGIDFLRFDMSEYMEKHSVARLIGSPPGYVGFEEGGLLIEEVSKKPHCVLLLDEIEKAHPDVLNILLQAMDRGEVTDPNGKTASFKNLILIMTSNIGAFEASRGLLGIQESQGKNSGLSLHAVKKSFTPEFLNRLSSIIEFQSLPKDILLSVIDKFLGELKKQLKLKNVDFVWTAKSKSWIYEKGYNPSYGARPFHRTIDEEVKKPLVDELLFGKLNQGGSVKVDTKGSKLDFVFST